MTDPRSGASEAARIAELEAALRYWESQARNGPADRADLARIQAAEMRSQLARLRSDGIENAAC